MPDFSDLAVRMKKYESVSRSFLMRRTPVIIRLDGKAFHTFTRGMKRPFDEILIQSMQDTMKYLCENIQGCVLGYHQSDEITLVLQDYKTFDTDAWFEYNVQKMCSIAASMATMTFNRVLRDNANKVYSDYVDSLEEKPGECVSTVIDGHKVIFDSDAKTEAVFDTYFDRSGYAMFDARVFNIPFEEVCNNLVWRQQDATRNSIQMVGQANFSHKQLQNKSCNAIQDMLMTEKGINWNDFPTYCKRGSCCIRKTYQFENEHTDGPVTRTHWVIDNDIPIFTKDREYVESRVYLRDLR